MAKLQKGQKRSMNLAAPQRAPHIGRVDYGVASGVEARLDGREGPLLRHERVYHALQAAGARVGHIDGALYFAADDGVEARPRGGLVGAQLVEDALGRNEGVHAAAVVEQRRLNGVGYDGRKVGAAAADEGGRAVGARPPPAHRRAVQLGVEPPDGDEVA